MAESRALGDEEKALDAEAERIEARGARPPAAHPERARRRLPRRRRRGRQRGAAHRGLRPGRLRRRTSGCPHWDIGTELGILDGERAAKISGSMFTMYRGWGARLLRAMVQLSLDRNADAYEEIRPPTLVRTDTMIATGHLPKFEEDGYHMERDDLWAIPTAEVPLTSLHRDEVLDEADLPAALHRPHVVLPPGGGCRRPRHARPAPRPRVRQGRAAGACADGAEQAIDCQEDVLARSESILARPRPGLPGRSTSAPATSARRPPAPGTSRPTRRAATCGSR